MLCNLLITVSSQAKKRNINIICKNDQDIQNGNICFKFLIWYEWISVVEYNCGVSSINFTFYA